jgi:hypothetical protein
MKLSRMGKYLLALAIWSGAAVYGQINFNNIAQLHWAHRTVTTFADAGAPYAIGFEGGSMWMTNWSTGSVTKMQASDGTVLGTFTVGIHPQGIAFDGVNMRVTNFRSNTVTKLRASDGANLGTFTVGTSPEGIAFDGTNVGVANIGSGTLAELQTSSGTVLATALVAIPEV